MDEVGRHGQVCVHNLQLADSRRKLSTVNEFYVTHIHRELDEGWEQGEEDEDDNDARHATLRSPNQQ
jgi:hypothetical protein